MKQFSKYLALVLMSMVLFSSCGKKDEPRKPEPTPAPTPEKPKPTPEKPDEPEKPEKPDLSNNVLAFVAEYDVNKAGTGFVTSHKLPTSNKYTEWEDSDAGLFTWNEAKALFKKDFLKDYVFPSHRQWKSIVKDDNIIFNKEHSKVSVKEENVIIGNEPKQTYQSEFITKQEGDRYVTFALRFKRTKWESAWAYYYRGQSVAIHCLGGLKDSGKTLKEIATPAFFDQNSKKLVTRIFPAYGGLENNLNNTLKLNIGNSGCFWSSTSYGNTNTSFLYFQSNNVYINSGHVRFGFAVRPFHKELPQK